MAYCPKCDMEFVEGVTVCSDCGSSLLDSKETAMQLRKEAQEKQQAAYMEQQQKLQELLAQAQLEEADIQERPKHTRLYVKKSQQYDDFKSAASSFLIVGGAVLIFAILTWMGVVTLPIAGTSRYISQSVMTFMGIAFVGIGLSSQRSAKQVEGDIASEESTTEELITWFRDNHTAQQLDSQILREYGSLLPEELSLKRFGLIQDILVTSHDITDQAYIDLISEEIYGKVFEE